MTFVKTNSTEQLLTIPQAAKQLDLPVYAVRRAAKAGLIPVHQPFNSRRLVLVSEIKTFVHSCKVGGAE